MRANTDQWIGIDLGTYNSSAAIWSGSGVVEIVRNAGRRINEGSFADPVQEKCKEFPSFISFTPEGLIEDIGINSKSKAGDSPELVVWGVKRLLGKMYSQLKESMELARFPYRIKPDRENGQCLIAVGNNNYTPVQLCAEIFKKIKKDAEIQAKRKIDSVVVSVPAYFDPVRVTPIVDAARIAGFVNIRTLPEPVAAALAYHIDITVKPMKTLVFDLGAGTLDVTAGYLCRHPDQPGEFLFQVIKNTGDPRLGGIDIDDRIVEYVKKKCSLDDLNLMDKSTIRRIAEISKIRLSEETAIEQELRLDGTLQKFSLDQYELRSILEGQGNEKNLLESCRQQVMAAITESGWNTQEIEVLVLIGGPTKLPCFHDLFKVVFYSNRLILEQLEDFYSGKEKVDRMTAVSIGAALSVHREVHDVVPHGHGIEEIEINEESITYRPDILIPRDSPYPFKSRPNIIQWVNLNGLFEFKIIQHRPKSEVGNSGQEYRFIGMVRFAVKNPQLSMVAVQMGYNENKELVIIIENLLSSSEYTAYVGINNFACIEMNYPISVKKPPSVGQAKFVKKQPAEDKLQKFCEWAQVIAGFIQRKVDNFQISQMLIQQILDEVRMLLRSPDVKSEYNQLFTKLNSLIWNASSKGLLLQSEFSDLNTRMSEFQSDLF